MPTVAFRRLDYDALVIQLRPGDGIVIPSCDCCAEQSIRDPDVAGEHE